MAQPLKLKNAEFASFYKENPGFDILHFNFHNDEVVIVPFVLLTQIWV